MARARARAKTDASMRMAWHAVADVVLALNVAWDLCNAAALCSALRATPHTLMYVRPETAPRGALAALLAAFGALRVTRGPGPYCFIPAITAYIIEACWTKCEVDRGVMQRVRGRATCALSVALAIALVLVVPATPRDGG